MDSNSSYKWLSSSNSPVFFPRYAAPRASKPKPMPTLINFLLMKNASLFSLSISKDSSFLWECQMIGWEEKGNFDKKEEVSECRVRKQENGRRKKVEKDVQKITINIFDEW